jgi:hypothetical protein
MTSVVLILHEAEFNFFATTIIFGKYDRPIVRLYRCFPQDGAAIKSRRATPSCQFELFEKFHGK